METRDDLREACDDKLRRLTNMLFYMKMQGQIHSEEYNRIQREVEAFSNYRDKLVIQAAIKSRL